MLLLNTWITLALVTGISAAPSGQESYDYIIVGGGTAGSALATRLSQSLANAKILLIEAGPSALDDPRINVPGMRGSILFSELDWGFKTIPQANLGGRQVDVNRGKVLGGSSAMNYLCYDRAAAAEYEAFSELGSPGWTWDAFFDAMTKSENFTGEDRDVRGRSGPIRNLYNRVLFDVLDTWEPTVSSFGVPVNDKAYMGGNPLGVMVQGTNIADKDHYTRSYSANSYLPLAGSNLVVKTNTQVAKVDFKKDKCHGKLVATGVTLTDGTSILAKKEVILSAGSVQSPNLLELSGIGRSDVLAAAGIAQQLELPGVGENYQDHIRVSNTYRLKEGTDSFDTYIFNSNSENATGEFQKWQNGQVSLYDYTTATYGFMTWDQVDKQAGSDINQLAQSEFGNSTNVIDQKKLQFLKDPSVPDAEIIFEANYVGAFGYTGGNFITLIPTVMHPLSRGSVHIDPANPQGKPIINPNYLSNEADMRGLISAAQFSRRIANTGPMKDVWEAETEPGPDVQTDAQWREFIAKAMGSFYHPVGTCALLPQSEGGVVDADLQVYGTRNLRVVDNSIIPIIISAHIQTAAYGIAEIAAEKIIAAANLK